MLPTLHIPRSAARAALLLVAGTLLPLGLLSACTADEQPDIDPATVLADASAAMQEIESFHFSYQVDLPGDAEPAEGMHLVALDGVVAVGGLMEATVDLQQNGVPLQLEFVADGGTHYVKNPTSADWQSVPASLSPVGELDLTAGTIQILERIQEPSYVGTEGTGGVDTHVIAGKVSAEDLASVAGAVTTEDPFESEIWIGAEDKLVRRIEVVGAALASETPGTKRVITLDQFDEPVTIEPPR